MAIDLIEEVGSFPLRNPTRKGNNIVVARKMQGDSERIDARLHNDDRYTAAGLWMSPEDIDPLIELLQAAKASHEASKAQQAA